MRKSTGIVRRIDELGRVVIPKELRVTMELPTGTPMEISVDGKKIILEKYEPDTWSAGELYDALTAIAKDTGKNPMDYLRKSREGAEPDG